MLASTVRTTGDQSRCCARGSVVLQLLGVCKAQAFLTDIEPAREKIISTLTHKHQANLRVGEGGLERNEPSQVTSRSRPIRP